MVAYSACCGIGIQRHWNLQSGSERQLLLERKTYLISTFLNYAFGFQIISFFLYIFTADHLHSLFVGAMCAAGVLHVNPFGYPTLILKAANCLLAGLWLILNRADNQAYDYPLTRKKYRFLLLFSPLILAEGFLQSYFFLLLKPDIITSCCGTLFAVGGKTLTAEMASLPIGPMKTLFFATMAAAVGLGVRFYRRGKGAILFSAASALASLVAVFSLISFISIYYYELPSHHCPFCLLQKEYGYSGYFFYASLLIGAVCGIGTGLLQPCRKIPSLSGSVPATQRKLALVAVVSFMLFTLVVAGRLVFSDFTPEP